MSKAIKSLLQQDAFLKTPKKINLILGIEASLYLMNLIEYEKFLEKNDKLPEDKFFYNSSKNIESYTRLKRTNQGKAKRSLENIGFIETKVTGCPATTHFRIDYDNIDSFLESIPSIKELQGNTPGCILLQTRLTDPAIKKSISDKLYTYKELYIETYNETLLRNVTHESADADSTSKMDSIISGKLDTQSNHLAQNANELAADSADASSLPKRNLKRNGVAQKARGVGLEPTPPTNNQRKKQKHKIKPTIKPPEKIVKLNDGLAEKQAIRHINFWNDKVNTCKIDHPELKKHHADPVKGGKTFDCIKTSIDKLYVQGMSTKSINSVICTYFKFLEQRNESKEFPGLYVGLNHFLKFDSRFDLRLSKSKKQSPLLGEKSWFDVIKDKDLNGLLSDERYNGVIKDKNPELTNGFKVVFARTVNREKTSFTPAEEVHFIKAGEYLAKFCDKYRKKIAWSKILYEKPINLIPILFEAKNWNLKTKSWFLISPKLWDYEFKTILSETGYI